MTPVYTGTLYETTVTTAATRVTDSLTVYIMSLTII